MERQVFPRKEITDGQSLLVIKLSQRFGRQNKTQR